MTAPEYLVLPDPIPGTDDEVTNNGFFPSLSISEFEKNYQVTDVFQGKTRYMLLLAINQVNSQLAGQDSFLNDLRDTYRMCAYACAMMMICQRYGSVDTQTKSEYEQEKKKELAEVYKNEYRRLLIALSGSVGEVT